HAVTLTDNTVIKNGTVVINGYTGKISGNRDFRVEAGSTLIIKENASVTDVKSFEAKNNSTIIVENNALISGDFNVKIEGGSTLNVNAGGEVYIKNYDMMGDSFLIVDGFMELTGNFKTSPSSHNVSGSG